MKLKEYWLVKFGGNHNKHQVYYEKPDMRDKRYTDDKSEYEINEIIHVREVDNA